MTRSRRLNSTGIAISATIAISGATSHALGGGQGACCVDTDCTFGSAHDCAMLGGVYLGDGTTCLGNPCLMFAGDTCDLPIWAVTGDNPFDTTTATDSGYGDPDESQCDGTFLDWDDSADRWFIWIAPGDGTVELDTCDATSYDTSLVLYQGLSCDTLTQVACNGDAIEEDPECQQYYSHIPPMPVASGETYYVRVGGWQAAQGLGTLTITYDGTNDPQGGCCVGQACVSVTEAYCTVIGGTYLGDGTTCADNPCAGDPTGACCIGSTCSTQTQVDCATAGGTYHGDDTPCTPNPCASGVGISWRVTGLDRTSLDQPHYTVDIYLEVSDGHRLDAVAGNVNQHKMLSTTSSFFQHPYGGPTSVEINPGLYDSVPDLEWDSRVTIGTLDASGDPWGSNELGDIGIDWTTFEAGGPLDVDNGTWFVLPTHEQGQAADFVSQDCSTRNGVLIARLTTMGLESEVLVEGLFQGRTSGGATWQEVTSGMITWQGEQDCNLNSVPDACDIANGTSDDINGNDIPDECENACPGDADGDGDADVDDILIVIAYFGSGPGGDLDGDGDTDVDDLLTCIAVFGSC